MEEFVVKDGKTLRLGYTTGTCATAASKAALITLLSGKKKEHVEVLTPKGIKLDLDILDIETGENSCSCGIKKDSGDDPDITNGTMIYAKVTLKDEPGIYIHGGKGVGTVTKKGLDQPVGNSAINSVPRRMITENLTEVLDAFECSSGLDVEISVPEGETLAKKTFNPRLGIVGGISIIGTSGIVEPMSEQALVDTIKVELSTHHANGEDFILLTPGNYGSDYIKEYIGIPPEKAVLTSNFIGDAMVETEKLGFKGLLLIGHIGKLVKLAANMFNTHSKYGDSRMDIFSSCAGANGLRKERFYEMLECATCDDAIRILKEENIYEDTMKMIVSRIEKNMKLKVPEMEIGVIVFSKEYGLLGESDNAKELLNRIKEQ